MCLALFIFLVLCNINSIYSQCVASFYVETTGFYCKDEGTICIVTVYKDEDCTDYEYQLEFPTTSFFVTNNGDFIPQIDPSTTIYTTEEIGTYNITRRKCIKGLLQIPNTTFTVRLVNKFDPTDILHTVNFKLDDYKLITGTNTVSSLISAGDLLPVTGPAPGPYSLSTPQKIVIDGKLIVDMDYSFSTGGYGLYNEIVMKKSSIIEVMSTKKLYTNRTNIYKCPEYLMWDKIDVLNAATLECDRTTISGAQTGVWLNQNSVFNSADVKIFENFCGLRAYDPAVSPMTASINTWYNPFSGASTVFTKNTYGMVLYDASPITLNRPFFIENEVGIYPANSSLTGTHITFKRNGYGIQCFYSNSLLDIQESHFDNNKVGIHTIAQTFNFKKNVDMKFNKLAMNIISFDHYTNYIMENELNNNQQGIIATAYNSYADISKNSILDISTPFSLNGIAPGIHSWFYWHNFTSDMSDITGIPSTTPIISLNNTNDANVQDNTDGIWQGTAGVHVNGGQYNYVNLNEIINDNTNGIGIRLVSSPMSSVRCNTVYATTGLNVLNTNSSSAILLNSFSGNGYNIQYGTAFNTMATSGEQKFYDNYFDASTNISPKARHYGSTFEINNSLYVEDDLVGVVPVVQGGNYFPYYLITPVLPWFSVVRDGENYTCTPLPLEPGDSSMFRMANEHIYLLKNNIGQLYNAEVEFDTKLKLMRSLSRLHEIGVLTDDQQAWYEELAVTEYGQFIDIENRHKEASSLSEDEERELEVLEGEIRERSGILSGIQWVRYNEESGEFEIDEESRVQYEEAKEALSEVLMEKGEILSVSRSRLLDILPELRELNDAIEWNGTMSALNLQTINGILYNRLGSEVMSYTDEERAKIVEIAGQCMGMGGEAVAQARSMRTEFDTDYYAYDDECLVYSELPEPRVSGEDARPIGISISPNPANGSTVLETAPVDRDRSVYVTDYLGRTVRTYRLEGGENRLNLDISGVSSGVYYVQIEGIGQVKKLVRVY